MNNLLFRQAIDSVTLAGGGLSAGIGTLGEKTLHSVLKHYLEPDTNRHEVKIDGFVADIASDGKIIEIQTRQFDKLRRKLARFLSRTDVTVVYPVARKKWLIWIDEATGECTKKRKSPKTGRPHEVFPELYKIKDLLLNKRLRICVAMVDLTEYRFLNGWSRDGKQGSERCDRVPVDIADEIYISDPNDYIKLIPGALPDRFTSRDFKAASGLSLPSAQTALNVLHSVGAVVRVGKKKNTYVYERSPVVSPVLDSRK
jgi:hypothetical protein